MVSTVCVIGAGTMGSGIAQVAAQSGLPTLLFDINAEMLSKAAGSIQKSLQTLADKQKISEQERTAIFNKIRFVNDISECVADLFIEAIVEKLEAKLDIFQRLAGFNKTTAIFASNTSSLSITAIQEGIVHPERVAGMHFFNPAPVMKLVEVVQGKHTSDATVDSLAAICRHMHKVPVICKDAPGFIVNRVARHYYLEAMKMVETGVASIEDIDAIMEASGFKMGPFKLMDLIGMDVNLAVSQSLYEAFEGEERFRPAAIQQQKVANGNLGRKTGEGFYKYS